MKSNIIIVYTFLFSVLPVDAQEISIGERLGYPKDAKLLILHADDVGVAHSENAASISALEKGPMNSASIMVPCSWFPEIASYARQNEERDFGIHLSLTSEWKNYKWGPVTSKDSVPSLTNRNGYFYASVDSVQNYGSPKEVEIELRNQIKKAYRSGMDVTHLDAHMYAAFSTPEFTAAYMKVGEEFGLPVLLDDRVHAYDNDDVKRLLDTNTVVVDRIISMEPPTYKKGAEKFYSGILENLEPGLNFLLVHTAYDDAEMRAITIDHPDFGAAWRQADYDFVTSKECADLLKEHNIQMVTWREIRDKIVRAE